MTGHVSITTDLLSVDQTKMSFMGITVHWIKIDISTNKWSLVSQVIAFQAITGMHNRSNLGRYLVGLCEHTGIITKTNSKVHHLITYLLCI